MVSIKMSHRDIKNCDWSILAVPTYFVESINTEDTMKEAEERVSSCSSKVRKDPQIYGIGKDSMPSNAVKGLLQCPGSSKFQSPSHSEF